MPVFTGVLLKAIFKLSKLIMQAVYTVCLKADLKLVEFVNPRLVVVALLCKHSSQLVKQQQCYSNAW